MSLTKLFNFRFLKQNIKKSKSGIIISIIIVPLILSIYMVLCGLNSSTNEFISHSQIGIYNLIFMYLIPFLYSVYLFGFVFKKPSTDFMNSMPINRKTMFVTNTIGGIILITIIQLLAAFFTVLWGVIFSKIIIFPADIIETFILCWSSYVFVFTSANLAMTFSGTVQTHFVVTAIIIFLIPVSFGLINTIYSLNDNSSIFDAYNLEITDGYQVTHYNLLSTTRDYTMPFKLFMYRWSYSGLTVVKMLVLSVVYFIIGLYLYQRRKMENNEESFGSVKLHILIKALTLIPVLLLANLSDVSDDPTALIVIVILSAIYYFVFDLIVRRKVPIKTSILSFFITIIVLQVSITTIKSIGNDDIKELDYNDIKSVSIGENSKTSEYFYYYSTRYDETKDLLDGNYFLEDDNILDLVLEAKAKAEKQDDNYDRNDDYPSRTLYFNLKTFSGKEYYTSIYISEKYYNKIIKELNKNEDYIKHIKNVLLDNDGVYQIEDDIVDSKTKKIIEKEIKDNLNIISNISSVGNNQYIEKIVYENHRLNTYRIPVNLSKTLFKAVAEFSNKKAVQNIKGYEDGLNVSVYYKGEFVKNIYDDEDILEFIEENYDDEFDPSKNYYVLDGSIETKDGYKTFVFYTNETKDVKSFLNDSTYKNNYYNY